MASLNDTINAITGRLLSEPLAPAVAASERSRNERDKLAAEGRNTKRVMDLEERRAKLEEEKAKSLLKLRNEFDEKQGELNREGRLREIEAQATAYIDRLTTVERQKELARLRSRLGVKLKGETVEEQIEDGLTREAQGDYPKAIGAHKSLEDAQKNVSDTKAKLDAALEGDRKFVEQTTNELAAAAAQKALMSSLTPKEIETLGGATSIAAIEKNDNLTKARREGLSDLYKTALDNAKPKASLLVLSRDFKRPLAEQAAKLQEEYTAAQNGLMRFELSDDGKLAQNRASILRGMQPSVGPLAGPEKMPPGEAAYDQAAKSAKAAAGAPAEFRATMGERQSMDEPLNQFQQPEINQPSLEQPLQAMLDAAKSRNASPEQRKAAEEALARRDQFLAQRMGVQPEQIGASVFSRSPESQVKSMIGNRDPRAMGFIDSMGTPDRDELYSLMMGNSLSPSRAGNPAIDAKAVAIWGPDAVPLLKEAEQLATSRGMDPGEQQAVFNAAISGDTNAQGKVKLMLDYVRQAKQADQTGAFQPVMPVREQYPGTINAAPVYQGPSFMPAR